MKTITKVNEIMEIIEEGKYSYYGLRGASEADMNNLERGYLDCSYVWADNECTEEQLNGTCALGIDEYTSESVLLERFNRAANVYAASTKTVLLIGDDTQEYGSDDDEVILGNNGWGANVIAIVKL